MNLEHDQAFVSQLQTYFEFLDYQPLDLPFLYETQLSPFNMFNTL
jgi:hypothetical protein